MQETNSKWTRRDFLLSSVLAGSAIALHSSGWGDSAKKRNIKLGFDNFSVRSMGWKAPELLDYAASLKVDVLMMSDLDVYESFEDDYLHDVKKKADELGIEIHAGTGGICPTSPRFNKKYGAAEEHLALAIRVAKALGSPVARCYLGSSQDRQGDGGIYRHIESTVRVCRAVRSLAIDANVKIAIENHAGDMQAWELVELIEAAGKEYVGATMDSGNAAWAIEDPMVNLEVLGPYAASSGMRDSAVWETEHGACVEWTNIGDGNVDWNAYLDRYMQICPNVPFILEIISQIGPRTYDYLKPEFWDVFPKARAAEFARFVALAKRGKPFVPPPERPSGERSEKLTQQQHQFDLERSIQYCKKVLGLGLH
ncbi:MAG: sugar phosphate isomerase/epimerase [Candidatus Omnitrophota bacterium]|jgi:sugar phosphate isomerase/epimerase|nr:MAG: sugar phosphate isomerase/epimerase [Candidatus Omnitrophota bacterium]